MSLRENGIADENFRRALSLAGGDPEINNNYGWFLCQTGREKDSIRYFLSAIKNPLYQTPEKSYTNAGICALKIDDLAMAEDYLQMAARRGRNVAATLLPLAQVKYRKGANVEVRALLADLHRQFEPTAESLWLSVRNERLLGDRSAEANFTGQLRRKFPDAPETQQLKRGNYQ
jgi:type IV pilus assembly protein PilF